MNILGRHNPAGYYVTNVHCHSFVSASPTNFENSVLTPIQLLIGLVLGSFSKVFDTLLTQFYAAVKDIAE